MKRIPIYLLPGLAASPEIFDNLKLPEDKYEIHCLEWKIPLTLEETIANYAKRMSEEVKEKNAVLIGVSFGGIMVQEMSKNLDTKKVIIISSVKHHNEFPKRYKMVKFTKAYKLFPTKVVSNFEDYTKYFVGKSLKKKAKMYKKYLSVRNKLYLNWSISNVVKWEQNKVIKNITHIHGTKDPVFPIKNIGNCISIDGGTHIMIITKAKKITKIIDAVLTS
jgi:esterase/lipase